MSNQTTIDAEQRSLDGGTPTGQLTLDREEWGEADE